FAMGGLHGFVDIGGSFTQIDVPGGTFTEAFGINDAGQIVGRFRNSTGQLSGFLNAAGSFTQIDVPGAIDTEAFGINDAGQIVGSFQAGAGTPKHGFMATSVSAVPGPVAGAGLPGLILAGGGLLGWWRRRRKKMA